MSDWADRQMDAVHEHNERCCDDIDKAAGRGWCPDCCSWVGRDVDPEAEGQACPRCGSLDMMGENVAARTNGGGHARASDATTWDEMPEVGT